MPENNQMMSLEGQIVGMPLAGPESFSQQQLEYLKRALGVDETVLFDAGGTQGVSSGDITEPYTNFDRLLVEVGYGNQITPGLNDGFQWCICSTRSAFTWVNYMFGSGGGNQYYATAKMEWTSSTHFDITNGSSIMHTETSTGVTGNTSFNANVKKCIIRIIGIHRIAGGN